MITKQHVLLAAAGIIGVIACAALLPVVLSDICYQLGVSLAEEGDGSLALKRFNAALFFDDDNPEIYRGIGEVYQSASQAEMEHFFKKNRIKKVITSQPPVKLSAIDQGAVQEDKVKVLNPSAHDIKTKIKKGPEKEIRFTETLIFTSPPYPGSPKGYETKAVAAFKAGLKLSPYDPRMYHGLGEMMQFGASVRETEKVFRKAAELDPNNPNIHYSFALFFLRKGMKAKALAEMRNATSIFPRESHRAFRAWLENGGTAAELTEVAGTSQSALYRLGMYYEKLNQPERAALVFSQACSVIGGNTDYRDSQEDPPSVLLHHLLERLEKYEMKEEYEYYRKLWKRTMAEPDKT